MILLFTDFSLADPYVGQMHRQIQQISPGTSVIDLFHSLPAFDVTAASCLLSAYCPPIENSVYCCVVDPGVGGDRVPVFMQVNGCYYVGPDNGVFELLARRHQIDQTQKIDWRPQTISNSFHGRDLFAPVAAKLANGDKVDSSAVKLSRYPDWPDELDEILYMDHFGNLITGRRADTISRGSIIKINGHSIAYAKTFSATLNGSLFWYENSNGLLEIAANKNNAGKLLNANIGDKIEIENSI